jgi:hypothetical protein
MIAIRTVDTQRGPGFSTDAVRKALLAGALKGNDAKRILDEALHTIDMLRHDMELVEGIGDSLKVAGRKWQKPHPPEKPKSRIERDIETLAEAIKARRADPQDWDAMANIVWFSRNMSKRNLKRAMRLAGLPENDRIVAEARKAPKVSAAGKRALPSRRGKRRTSR